MAGAPDPALVAATADGIAARHTRGTLVAGLSGPQGSGKSTLAAATAARLRRAGLKVAVLSLDDLYLGRDARRRLAREVHPLFATRGPPGTHDVALGLTLLDALARPGETALPRFAKATDEPAPPASWERFAGPADVVLFEGWCLGARPDPQAARAPPLNALERDEDADGAWRAAVEAALARGYPELWGRLALLVQLLPPDFGTVLGWRAEQEHALRDRLADGGGGGAMTDAQVARFVQHYERITRRLMADAPRTADVVVRLDAGRRVMEVAVRGG